MRNQSTTSEVLEVGVAGCGYWGPNLIRNFHSLDGCRVKRVCDLDADRLSFVRKAHRDIETTSDIGDLFGDPAIGAIVVATPVNTHFALAKEALLAGKHVLIEKPMARSSAECQELISLAADHHLRIMVGHTFLFSPPVQYIKQIVDSGEIGELYYISSNRLNLGLFQNDINVAWDLAPHDISIILYIMSEFPTSVNCQGKAHLRYGIEDVISMTLEFSNGGFATINNSWLDPSKVRRMTFVGSKKMILYDDTEPLEKIRIYDKRVEAPPYYSTLAEFNCAYHYGDMYAPHLDHAEPLRLECEHFLGCIRSRKEPRSSGTEGLQVVRVLEAATVSLTNKGMNVLLNHCPSSASPLFKREGSARELRVAHA